MRRLIVTALAIVFVWGASIYASSIKPLQFGGTGTAETIVAQTKYARMNAGQTAIESSGLSGVGSTGAAGATGARGIDSATSPLVLTSDAVSCPTCMTQPAPSTTSGIVGGRIKSAATSTWRIFSDVVQSTLPQPALVTLHGGYLRNPTIYYSAAQPTGAWMRTQGVVSPESGLGGNGVIGVGTQAAAGGYIETVGFQRVNAGDYLYWRAIAGAVTVTAPNGYMAEFVSDTGVAMLGTSYGGTVPANVTRYLAPFTPFNGGWSSNPLEMPVPFPGTLQNFCLQTNTSQASNGSLVVTVTVAGSNSTLTRTLATSAAAGLYCDITHTVAVTDHQTIGVKFVNGSPNSVSANVTGFSMEYLPTSGTAGIIGGSFTSGTPSGTQYWGPYTGDVFATDALAAVTMPRAGTTTDLCVYFSGAVSFGHSFTVEKNGADTSLVLAAASNGGANTQCASGSVSFAQGDSFSLKTVKSGSNVNWQGWMVDY